MSEISYGSSEQPQPDNNGHLVASRELPIPGSESVKIHGEVEEIQESSVEDLVAKLAEKFLNTPELAKVDIYEALRQTIATKTKDELRQLVEELRGDSDELITRCADDIYEDLFKSDFATGHRAPDSVETGTAYLVEASIDNKEINPGQIEKALSLTIKNALYKTSKWRHPSEDLEMVIETVRKLNENGSTIDLDRAGIREIESTMIQLVASIDVDLKRHPNYQYTGNGFLPHVREEYSHIAELAVKLK